MSRRPPPRQGPTRRPEPRRQGPTQQQVQRVWITVAAVFGLLIIWRFGHLILGGGGSSGELPTPGATSQASPTSSKSPVPAEGSVSATFPELVRGARLELKVFGLGNTPESCTPADISIGNNVRTAYHFDCRRLEPPASTAYFFLVKLTNHTNSTVPAELSGFTVSTSDGGSLSALDATGATYQRPFISTVLLPDASVKGWVTFDGSPPFTPSSLSYQDGGQTLTVRFHGEWVKT